MALHFFLFLISGMMHLPLPFLNLYLWFLFHTLQHLIKYKIKKKCNETFRGFFSLWVLGDPTLCWTSSLHFITSKKVQRITINTYLHLEADKENVLKGLSPQFRVTTGYLQGRHEDIVMCCHSFLCMEVPQPLIQIFSAHTVFIHYWSRPKAVAF